MVSCFRANAGVPAVVPRAAHEPDSTCCCCATRPLTLVQLEKVSGLEAVREEETVRSAVAVAELLKADLLPAASTARTV